jgi:CTD small phosphatase-like protein 2
LNKTLIIDNLADNFKLQPNNGLFIKTWNGDMRDTHLYDLKKLLLGISFVILDLYSMQLKDVRGVIKKVKDEVNKRLRKNAQNHYTNLDLTKLS